MAYTGKKVEEKQPFVLMFSGIDGTVSIQLNAFLNFVCIIVFLLFDIFRLGCTYEREFCNLFYFLFLSNAFL